jgi:hypothetical protein
VIVIPGSTRDPDATNKTVDQEQAMLATGRRFFLVLRLDAGSRPE